MHNPPLKKLLCAIAVNIGLSASLTAIANTPPKFGFVASFLIPEMIRDINAIQLALNKYNPAPIQAAERRGVYAVGYASDMAYIGPKMALTSIVTDWAPRREPEALW